jgi:tripartite-type tricarboxylate transporter receptor subunit TctC
VVLPFPAGGFVDAVARQIQPQLQTALGQSVVIDNRGGAGGTLGASEVARTLPDVYKILLFFDSYAVYPLAYPRIGDFQSYGAGVSYLWSRQAGEA